MLGVLREKSRSWIVKLLLGMIVLVFALFFGFNEIDKQTSNQDIVATVNEIPITQGEFRLTTDNIMNFYKQLYPENLPPDISDTVQNSALQQLIEQTLLVDQSTKLTLKVTEKELLDYIMADKQFYSEGKFDPLYYRESILPFFERRYDLHYEALLQKRLLASKMRDLFDDTVVISDSEIKSAYLMENTKSTFDVVTINPASVKKPEEAHRLATEIQTALSRETPINALLKESSLKKEFKTVSPANAESAFGDADVEILSRIFSLTEKSPALSDAININGIYYAVRLQKQTAPTDQDWEKEKDNFTHSYLAKRKQDAYRSQIVKLNQSAKIEIFLQ